MEPKLVPPTKPIAPPGLQKLIEQCQNLYPDQKNPLQVTTLLKYWYVYLATEDRAGPINCLGFLKFSQLIENKGMKSIIFLYKRERRI